MFFTPPRPALTAPSHAEATRLARQLTGFGISQQSYALATRILEVDEWITNAPCRVVEVHPEVSFAALIGRPADAPKKTWAGMVQRRSALTAEGIIVAEVTGEATIRAAVDDMLDAAVAAWTARRVPHAGTAWSIPHPPEILDSGDTAAIWA